MHDIADLIEGMRGVYLKWLTAAFTDLRKKKTGFFAEPAMQIGGDLVRQGPLSLPFRCDALVVSRNGKSVTPTFFPAERRWNFSPEEFESGGLTISLSPCHWESARLKIWGDSERVAASVKAWFESAFMPAEVHAEDEIQEVIHDISDFVVDGQIIAFTADFGTMPVAQVFALFDCLQSAGATRLELSMP